MRYMMGVVAVATALLLGGVLVVLAQGGAAALLDPVIVQVKQAVPATVSLAGVVDGQAVTLTAPVTVEVTLEVRIAGGGAAVAVQTGPAAKATPSQAGANDAAVLEQLAAWAAACNGQATRAQQMKAMEPVQAFFAGRDVRLAGTVMDVRDLSGDYDVLVTLAGAVQDVRMKGISEEQALALHKGQPVTLVGTADVSGCYAYVTVVGTLEVQ